MGSVVLPGKKWNQHHFWGRFRNMGDFQSLEESRVDSIDLIQI